MRLALWIVAALVASVLFHARLAGWPIAPDLPLALVAWAVVTGDPRSWMWRVWLVGAVRDLVDPGSQWFYAGAHVVLIIALVPLRRWLPGLPWLALLVTGIGASLALQAIDIVVGGLGGWTWWSGLGDALLTGASAVLCGRLVPSRRRTVVVPEAEPAADGDQPERSVGN